MILVLYMRN